MQPLRFGLRTDYHTFMHIPQEVRQPVLRLGLGVKVLETQHALRILDSYTVTTGLRAPEVPATDREPFQSRSLNLTDWSASAAHEIEEGVSEVEKRRLHLDDNTSVLLQYNDEKAFIDYWQTRFIPYARAMELAMVHAVLTGVHSEAFYRQFAALCDGIIDVKSAEEAGGLEHYTRVRALRGKPFDSRWYRLRVRGSGEVTLDPAPVKVSSLGIRGWIKGPPS